MPDSIAHLYKALESARELEKSAESSFLKEFGRILKEKREQAGLTQESLAKLTGITRTSITNMEAGKQDTTLGRLIVLAASLGCEPSSLVPCVMNGGASDEK